MSKDNKDILTQTESIYFNSVAKKKTRQKKKKRTAASREKQVNDRDTKKGREEFTSAKWKAIFDEHCCFSPKHADNFGVNTQKKKKWDKCAKWLKEEG